MDAALLRSGGRLDPDASRQVDVDPAHAQHLFQGKNVSYFRAASEGHLAEKGPIKMAQDDLPDVDNDSHLELASTDHLLKGETDVETIGDFGAPNAPISSGKKKEKSDSDEKCDEGPTHDDGATPSKLSAVFRGAWDETYPSSFLPAFDGKDMGQFKNLVQRCPDGLGAAIVDHSVRQWHAFCSYACSTEGAFNLPNMPHLGTLLKFVQSASNLYMEQREVVAKVAQKQSPKYVPPQPTKAPERPSEKATLEEVAAILGKKLD